MKKNADRVFPWFDDYKKFMDQKTEDAWSIRLRQNGVSQNDKIYTWKPTIIRGILMDEYYEKSTYRFVAILTTVTLTFWLLIAAITVSLWPEIVRGFFSCLKVLGF